jgi:Protein of unknown function (DUF2442)
MNEIVKVVRVKPLGGYRLHLAFSDGSEGERDFADVIAEGGPMVEPLADESTFTRVFLELGVPTWPNGFDVDSIALHDEMREAGLLQKPAA